MTTAYLSLGSDRDRQARLCRCLDALEQRFGPLRISTVYRCPAVGFEGRDFYNLAVAIRTGLPPSKLDEALKEIEDRLGRRRDQPKFSDRLIDIDLLLLGDQVGRFGNVELPRPDILRYDFVLGPLAELAPDRVHPVVGRTLGDLWTEMAGKGHSLTAIDLDCDAVRRKGSP